jgi:RNA polymerase sigma-70 factor (ECF subfamily)
MDPATATPDVVPDAVLIDRIRAGDVQAYGTLVQRYERGILGTVLTIVRDRHAAQDVVQDVFVQCYLKLPALRDGSRFGWWLSKAARRQAVRTSRRLKRTQSSMMRAVEADLPPHDSSALQDTDEEQQHLLKLVRRLPAHERLMVSLRYFDGHSVKEIAQMTGRPIGTVTKQLSRALERLRGEIQQQTSENQSCPPQMKEQQRSAAH